MKVISVVGKKNSGKTSLTMKIIKELKNRGFKVASIKHSHHEMEMDRENTDTWKHKLSGSQVVVGIGNTTFFNIQEKLPLDRLLFLIKIIDNVDFVVIEGFKNYNYPKIATSDEVIDEYTIKVVDSFKINNNEIKDLVNNIEEKSCDILDTLFLDTCNFSDGESIAKEIIKGNIQNNDLDKIDVNLSIDNTVIGLNEFVSNFIKKTTMGIINTLNIEDYSASKKEKIEILIKNNDFKNVKINKNINLWINGKKVKINNFVKNFMINTIFGMINSLKLKKYGVKQIDKAEIEIKNIKPKDLSVGEISLLINKNTIELNDFSSGILKESLIGIISSLSYEESLNKIKIIISNDSND